MQIKSATPIRIPSVWKALLHIEQIPADANRGYEVPLADKTAYRMERREVTVCVEGLTVYAILCSGDNNYWMDYELWSDKGDLLGDTDGDPDFDIPEVLSVYSNDGDTVVEVPVEFY